MFYIGLIIVISCIIYLFVAFNKNSFINFKEIYENYNSIFKKFSESFPFKILPFIFGLGLSFIVSYSEEVLIQLIVFISIIISMLFASFSMILSRDMLKKEECVQLKRIAIIDKGKGYGKEILRMAQKMAFEIWNTKRLYLSTKEENLRAQSIYKSAGFVPDMPDPCTCFHMDREDYERIIYNR